MGSVKRWEYAITVEEGPGWWTLWLQKDDTGEVNVENPQCSFERDVAMLAYMSSEGWELMTEARLHDGVPRLFFKRRLK